MVVTLVLDDDARRTPEEVDPGDEVPVLGDNLRVELGLREACAPEGEPGAGLHGRAATQAKQRPCLPQPAPTSTAVVLRPRDHGGQEAGVAGGEGVTSDDQVLDGDPGQRGEVHPRVDG